MDLKKTNALLESIKSNLVEGTNDDVKLMNAAAKALAQYGAPKAKTDNAYVPRKVAFFIKGQPAKFLVQAAKEAMAKLGCRVDTHATAGSDGALRFEKGELVGEILPWGSTMVRVSCIEKRAPGGGYD